MKQIKTTAIIGILFVLIIGTLSHYVYEWSGKAFWIGFFFPVSESTWEHMKLVFFPMLLYSFYMNRHLRDAYPCVTSALLFGTLLGTFSIPVIFYTYTGILGTHFLALDILTFAAAVLLAFFFIYRFSKSCTVQTYEPILKLSVLLLAVCFFLFTYIPPGIGLFMPPSV